MVIGKKIKKKKVILFFLFLIFISYLLFRSKNYEIHYTLDAVSITESFNKKEKMYSYLFKVNDKEFFVTLKNKYVRSKKLIDSIEIKEEENTICIFPHSHVFDFYPLCYQDDELISYHLIEKEDFIPSEYYKEINNEEKKYENLNIYSLNNKTYFLWNYTGFYKISDAEIKSISLFNEDVYNIPLAIRVGDTILIADYESKYVFHKFYVVNTKNNKVKELHLENELSFESYFLGATKKNAYLVDKKNKKEYEINPKRMLIHNITNKNKGRILLEDKWESMSMNTLVNTEMRFTHLETVQYKLENDTLYSVVNEYQTKLSNKKVKEIISYDDTTVYYLVDDQLYYYNTVDGEVLVISNFEWNFNYKNMIYIF